MFQGEEVQPLGRTTPTICALTLNYNRAVRKATFSNGDYSGSCGMVVCDHRGKFLAAASAKQEHVVDLVSAEAAALFEGLKLGQSIACSNILV